MTRRANIFNFIAKLSINMAPSHKQHKKFFNYYWCWCLQISCFDKKSLSRLYLSYGGEVTSVGAFDVQRTVLGLIVQLYDVKKIISMEPKLAEPLFNVRNTVPFNGTDFKREKEKQRDRASSDYSSLTKVGFDSTQYKNCSLSKCLSQEKISKMDTFLPF